MILDGQAQFGPGLTGHHLSIYQADTAEQLLRSYDQQGIGQGLVHAASAAFSEVTPDYIAANDNTRQQISGHGRLHGSLRINPNAGAALRDRVQEAARQENVRALVFAPVEDGFALDDVRLRPYLDLAREHSLLTVFLLNNFHHRETMPLRLKNWLYDYPDVPVLITQIAFRTQSDSVLIAEDHANVFLGTSDSTMLFLLNNVEKLGVDRFIFTTNFPFSIPALELMKINKLPVNDTDRQKILFHNLNNILQKRSS